VMKKIGMGFMGDWVWRGEAVWLSGRWQVESRLCIYGGYLLE